MAMLIERLVKYERKNVCLLVPKSGKEPVWENTLARYLPDLEGAYGKPLPSTALGRDGEWHLASSTHANRLKKMRGAGPTLSEYVHGRIFYGVKTGLNEAWVDDKGRVYTKGEKRPRNAIHHGVFAIDSAKRAELIDADPRSAEIIKPRTVGRDVKKWSVERRDKWLIYSPWHLDITKYPAVRKHLAQFREALEARPECRDGVYNWWCMARFGAEYVEEFDKPKIVYQEIATYQAFALDSAGSFLNNKVFMICTDDTYLLGILNSKPAWAFLGEVAAKLVGGAFAMQLPSVSQIPIPTASAADRTAIAALAQKCLDAQGVNCQAWEKEIDERVAALYGIDLADLLRGPSAR